MASLSQPDPQGHGARVPPRRLPTTVGAGELPPESGYWEVWVHSMLSPVRLPGRMPEALVRSFAGKRGRYRFRPGGAE